MRLGALEAGGTKMVCSVGYADGTILERASFETVRPEEMFPTLIGFFKDKGIEALGIGSFGPVDLHPDSPTYGYVTTTPKGGWRNAPLMPVLRDALGIPTGVETDVNIAALGEAMLGAGKGLQNVLYITVGTGIGGGIYIEGNLLHGLVHSELGHLIVRPAPGETHPDGFCPYHKGCLEGLASGPAIEKRWGKPAHLLPPDHPAWDLEVEYLAQMCVNSIFVLSPECIVLGGGVMHQAHLFPRIRRRTLDLLGGYVYSEKLLETPEAYIVPPGLGDNSGVTGALLIAKDAHEREKGARS